MQEEINTLKSELIAHREEYPTRRSMPIGFWPRVKKLAEQTLSKNPFVKMTTADPASQKTVMKISVSDQVTIEIYS